MFDLLDCKDICRWIELELYFYWGYILVLGYEDFGELVVWFKSEILKGIYDWDRVMVFDNVVTGIIKIFLLLNYCLD